MPERDRHEPLPRALWRRIHEDPTRAPEHIALAAAEHFAPQAERWTARMRHRHAPPELAWNARSHHVRLARLEGAAAGLGGALTVVPDLAALAWIQSRMVFFIAAANGFDPRHPMRPAELLALQELYPSPAEARAALDGLGRPIALQYIVSKRKRDEQLASRLLRFVGRRLARRAAQRVLPLISSPMAAVQNARVTADLGNRALVYYGGDHAGLPPAVGSPAQAEGPPVKSP
jgi:hypothetical protein